MACNEAPMAAPIPLEVDGTCAQAAPSGELSGWLNGVVRECLKRVRRWQAPPNWTRAEWLKEMAAQGQVAALEALKQYDASRNLTPASFALSRVTARVLTRYRQEWAFGGRWVEPLESTDLHENGKPSSLVGAGEGARKYEELRGALARLEEFDRWMLQRLFWEGRVQGEVARELGVSQAAVCKRKRLVLDKLRRFLTVSRTRAEGRL